jgi:Kef-type K+ transport system membrane component KefB
MSFATLALIAAVAVLGPVLALPRGWRLPVVLGELVGGIALGPTGFGVLHAYNETFAFLAEVGFALVMFVAGSHVPVRDGRLRAALPIGVLRAVGVGVLSAGLGVVLARLFGTGHGALYGGAAGLVVGGVDPADGGLAAPGW